MSAIKTKPSWVEGLGGDFAYLRCRKITPGSLQQTDHVQVWQALQLLHAQRVQPWEDKPILFADEGPRRLVYLPDFNAAASRRLLHAVRGPTSVLLFTWSPERLRTRLRNEPQVRVEEIPPDLVKCYGRCAPAPDHGGAR